MKNWFFLILLFCSCRLVEAQQCTKIGTFVGTYQPSIFTYLDAENPELVRTIFSDDNIELMAANQTALDNFELFLDSLQVRGIETVVTIRFPYNDSLSKEDRILSTGSEIDDFINNLQVVLDQVDGKLAYLQVLNEPFGIGRYNTTLDSIAAIQNQNIAEQSVLAWMDTISNRFRGLIDAQAYNIELLSPSLLAKGIEAVKNGQSSAWTYRLTTQTFYVADEYCDGLNFHWYPESYQSMQQLVDFVDTSAILAIDTTIYKTCTEWSQAHEIRDILQADTAFWNSTLLTHCGTSDTNLEADYLALINDSLGIDHQHSFDMFMLMNAHNYRFASYFTIIQDHYSCGEPTGVWYALADLYATQFTANKVANGKFNDQYQAIKQYISSGCGLSAVSTLKNNPIKYSIYPNPTKDYIYLSPMDIGFKLDIYSSLGQLLSQHINPRKIDVQDLPKGIYFARIQREGEREVIKFIKH